MPTPFLTASPWEKSWEAAKLPGGTGSPIPAASTEIHRKPFGRLSSLIRFSSWWPSSWADAVKRLREERI